MTATIRLLSVMEATTVTGPAKNLLGFAGRARSREFTEALGLPRVELTIATFRRGGDGAAGSDGSPNAFVSAARAAGVEVLLIPESFRFDPRALAGLRRAIEQHAPDIVQTHSVKSHFLLRLSGLGRRRPWVAFHHGYTAPDAKMRLYNQLDRWSLPAAARVVTVCGPFAEQLARTGVRREKISVLHNSVVRPAAVLEDDVRALKLRLGVGEGERIILAVGRLSREKGHAELVEALEDLRRLAPELSLRLVLVGDGPERARLEEQARARGVAGRVVFAGHNEDVRPFYALANVLALPSHSEGSPNVLLEAMAAGVPVVSTAVGGVPEIVSHEESALLVSPHDAQALAAALARMLTDEPLARDLAARASVLAADRFSPEAYARSILEIYRDLSASRLR
jgi:glycosyltransferase involved in cell wall biosynthesis